jgi:VIT1/CCC1 family predicted Fe2+/Mn2+ transporter
MHRTDRIGWLRAAVLVVGVVAAQPASEILVAAVAGLVAGAMSMAAGEYVSVSSQADTERADLGRERIELAADSQFEHEELAAIYVRRGLDTALARQVAEQLMAHGALGAHARDELGISEITTARPIQAALASAATFAVGAAMPVLTVLITPRPALITVVIVSSILFLAVLGGFGTYAGGTYLEGRAARYVLGRAGDGALTAGVGAVFGATP